jgi:hypothetical protein
MPSSREHCLPCGFNRVTPTDDPAVDALENHLVGAGIAAQVGVNGESDSPPYELPAERLIAARDCADCIFRRECQAFGYKSAVHSGTRRLRVFIIKRLQV